MSQGSQPPTASTLDGERGGNANATTTQLPIHIKIVLVCNILTYMD